MISAWVRWRSVNCEIAASAALAIVLLAAVTPARGDDKRAESAAILERARQLEDLRSDGGGPFVLSAQIQATREKVHAPGIYRLTWLAPDRWHEELQLGDFKRVRDGVDGGYRQIRSSDFQPQVIFDLDQLLDVAAVTRPEPKEAVGKTHQEKIGGVELSCVDIQFEHYRRRELCFDPATGALVRATLELGGTHEFDYAGALSLGTKQFPSELRSQRKGDFSLDVSVQALTPPPGDAASLPVPDPARSEFWGTCKDAISPELKQRVDPIYPQQSKAGHEQGTVFLYARIESDGAISHLKALSGPSAGLAQAALDAVAQWKYTPEMCGNTPETTETIIEVIFTLGG